MYRFYRFTQFISISPTFSLTMSPCEYIAFCLPFRLVLWNVCASLLERGINCTPDNKAIPGKNESPLGRNGVPAFIYLRFRDAAPFRSHITLATSSNVSIFLWKMLTQLLPLHNKRPMLNRQNKI